MPEGRGRSAGDERLTPIVARLTAVEAGTTVLVGIDGAGGSGKSVLAGALAVALRAGGRRASVVHFDDFFLPSSERPRGTPEAKPVGGDFDWRRLRDEVLRPLRADRTARSARYDWSHDAFAGWLEVPPGHVVIVEGVTCTRRELRDAYDVRVWVECARDVRLARGLRRDGEGARGRWEEDWQPSEDRYAREHRPREAADFVVRGDDVGE